MTLLQCHNFIYIIFAKEPLIVFDSINRARIFWWICHYHSVCVLVAHISTNLDMQTVWGNRPGKECWVSFAVFPLFTIYILRRHRHTHTHTCTHSSSPQDYLSITNISSLSKPFANFCPPACLPVCIQPEGKPDHKHEYFIFLNNTFTMLCQHTNNNNKIDKARFAP